MLSIVVAYDRNRVIGRDNRLPWHLPNDLAYFKRVTTGKTVVMGRKTFDSIGRPLPNRTNVVLTRSGHFSAAGVQVVHTVDEVLALDSSSEGEVCIIGGAELFRAVLPYVRKLYVTFIDEQFEGDTFFPEVNLDEWQLVSEVKGEKDEKNPYDYYFMTYVRE
jgi:dihydrofolate reductase